MKSFGYLVSTLSVLALTIPAFASGFKCEQISVKKVRDSCIADRKAQRAPDSKSRDEPKVFAEEARDQVRAKLKDPDSARFSKLMVFEDANTRSRVLCGEVNSKNSYGGYSGSTLFFAKAEYSNDALAKASQWIVWVMPSRESISPSDSNIIDEQMKMVDIAMKSCSEEQGAKRTTIPD